MSSKHQRPRSAASGGRKALRGAILFGALGGFATFAYAISDVELLALTKAQADMDHAYGPGSLHRHWRQTAKLTRLGKNGRIDDLFITPAKSDRADLVSLRSFGASDLLNRNDTAENHRRQIARELASMSASFEDVTGVKPEFTITAKQQSRNDLIAKITGVQPVLTSRELSTAPMPLPLPRPMRMNQNTISLSRR